MSSYRQSRYTFDWEILDVVIGGNSAIDSEESLNIRNHEEAVQFLDCYGFDTENLIEKAELFGHYQEAVNFIRQYFLFPQNPDGLKQEIPRKLMELSDPVQLLSISSQATPGTNLHLWACAIIKVMHTISHMDKDLRAHYLGDIQTQIMDQVYRHIHNEEGSLFLGRDMKDPDRVPLVVFETKPKKSRDSVLLKLLHKPENVAEDIFDRVGLRFVTATKFDALRVVKFLRDRYIIMPANIKPSRSRNTLLNLSIFKRELKKILSEVPAETTEAELDRRMIEICEMKEGSEKSDNPHSSSDYSAIQFTCRQLIKIKNPLFEDLKALKSHAKETPVPDELARIIDRIDLRSTQKQIKFFYPFEVQVVDEKSHQQNLAGSSAHAAYKKNQIQAAMKRVLRGLS